MISNLVSALREVQSSFRPWNPVYMNVLTSYIQINFSISHSDFTTFKTSLHFQFRLVNENQKLLYRELHKNDLKFVVFHGKEGFTENQLCYSWTGPVKESF